MTLQDQYSQIQEGKGNKSHFLKQARHLFPEYVNHYNSFNETVKILKSKNILTENIAGLGMVSSGGRKDWFNVFNESVKAEEKKVSKEVTDDQSHAFDNKDVKNIDNLYGQTFLNGFYTEMQDPKNQGKSVDELKQIVAKNLGKDWNYYAKNAQFGIKGIGYTKEAPGLGEPKEPKGKYKASGYGDIPEKTEKPKSNTKDTLSDKEAKITMPKKVKEMPVAPQNLKGVKKMPLPGKPKTIKLQESNSSEYVVWIQPEGEEKKEYNRAKSKSQAMTIANNFMSRYEDDYNPPEVGIMTAEEWKKENNMSMQESYDYETQADLHQLANNSNTIRNNPKVKKAAEFIGMNSDNKDNLIMLSQAYFKKHNIIDSDMISHIIDQAYNILKSRNKNINELNMQESKLRAVIKQLIKEELNMKEIEESGKEAEYHAKTKKISEEIMKRKKKLKALTTLEEMEKGSTNKDMLKSLKKEIKTLENLKMKLDKKYSPKEEVIGEEENTPE